MFIAALFIIAKTWKQPRCPAVSEWRSKLWCIHTMKYSTLKRYNLSSHETTWRKLKRYYQVKEANMKRLPTVWFQLYDVLEKTKLWRQKKRSGVVRSRGRRGWGDEEVEHRIFMAVKLFRLILWRCICVIIHLSKPMECITPRTEPDVNYGLDVIMRVDGGPLVVTNGPLWRGMLMMAEAVPVWRQEDYVSSLCAHLSISLWTKNFSENIMSLRKKTKTEAIKEQISRH